MTLLSRFEVVQSFLDLFERPAFLEIAAFQSDTFDRVAAHIKVLIDESSVYEATNRIENSRKISVFPFLALTIFTQFPMSKTNSTLFILTDFIRSNNHCAIF